MYPSNKNAFADHKRWALHDFLTAHRQRMSPESVGLLPRTRGGAVGLRREEVAALAGVSVSWYTRLEQGQPIGVSPELVDSIARVFRMSAAETHYFHILAREQTPIERHSLSYRVAPQLQTLLDGLNPFPACIINPVWDVIAWNWTFSLVFGDYALLSQRERNSIWRMFVDPTWHDLIENWDFEAAKATAIFRHNTQKYVGEAWFHTFLDDLHACSPEFGRFWQAQEVEYKHDERKVICHPRLGKLALCPTTLQVVEAGDLRVIVDIPLSEFDTEQKLRRLRD